MSSIKALVAIFAVVNVVARAICGIVLMGKHAWNLALELFKFGVYVLQHFGIFEVEIFKCFGVCVFGVGLVENIKFFVAQACTARAVFATSEVIRKVDAFAIGTILAEIGIITGIAINAFVAKLAILTKGAVGAIGEGAGIFAVVGLLAVARVETHVAILGDGSDVAVVTIFTGAGPGAALRSFHKKGAEIGDEGGWVHAVSLVDGGRWSKL